VSSLTKAWPFAAVTLLLFSACAAPPRAQPEVDAFGVHVAAEHSGSSVTLEREQALVVRLNTLVSDNAEWSLVDFSPGVLAAPAAPRFQRGLRASNVNEASGAVAWRFLPAVAGTVVLKFDYRRPRSLEPALQSVSYTVTVR
jgi:hypothetical protein